MTRVDVAPAGNSLVQESFQCPKNLKQKQGKTVHSAYSGLSHGLSALWTPAPHVLVQWDQEDQAPHSPWTASGVFPTVMHSPEKHHWGEKKKHKELRIIITEGCFWQLFVISAYEGWTLKWKCKWQCHRMTVLHTQQRHSYSWLLSALGQAAQPANSKALSHLVFSTPSAICSCIQFGAAGAFHWAPECLAKVLKKKENCSSLRQGWTPMAKIFQSHPQFCTAT